jgi:hypothetical protein
MIESPRVKFYFVQILPISLQGEVFFFFFLIFLNPNLNLCRLLKLSICSYLDENFKTLFANRMERFLFYFIFKKKFMNE